MDALMLSRLQFTATTIFHFLFVPLTLGLSVLVAIMETRYARTGDEIDLKMTRFWGKIFLINFAVGVVTGITLEFQFGTNWSAYSAYVGDIFGSLLAIEATAAFFLESTLIGVLQHPVGYALRNGRAELTDFAAVVFNPFSILQILHVIPAAFLLTAFFIMGISAYHLLQRQNVEFFTRSFRLALVVGAVATAAVVVGGDIHAKHVTKVQPAKLAAMESLWDTTARAPVYLMAIPDEAGERNRVEIGAVPGLLSFLGHGDFNATVKGLKEFPREERPPVLATFLSFRVMVALGTYFAVMVAVGLVLRKRLPASRRYLKLMVASIPLPFLANTMGWVLAEVGRQPWLVYGLMRTAEGVSPIDAIQVALSLTAFILVYGLLGAVGYYLIGRTALQGPDAVEPSAGAGGKRPALQRSAA
ncbi:MAG: cytochrome ubiquinol oxidase subunit I [Desulfobacterales bacterium]|nr:cytochrome ubiquinol oxidase subunit I [Desulfobacterales bacterium]